MAHGSIFSQKYGFQLFQTILLEEEELASYHPFLKKFPYVIEASYRSE